MLQMVIAVCIYNKATRYIYGKKISPFMKPNKTVSFSKEMASIKRAKNKISKV